MLTEEAVIFGMLHLHKVSTGYSSTILFMPVLGDSFKVYSLLALRVSVLLCFVFGKSSHYPQEIPNHAN